MVVHNKGVIVLKGLLFFIVFLLTVIILTNIFTKINDRKNYLKEMEKIKEEKNFGYANYKDFINEFNKHEMYNHVTEFGFYFRDYEYMINRCYVYSEIVFDSCYMILSYKDHIKANRFIKKELEKIKEEKTEINNLHKWDKN